MLGAIIGDISGSRFERRSRKSKEFELLSARKGCRPTDDSIMTLAIARAILDCRDDYSVLSEQAVSSMQTLGREYPYAGYGGRFKNWIFSLNPAPYYSYGNGAAMRVSPCGFAASSLEEASAFAREVTKVTHDHPEGMKAAEAVSSAIYLARTGKSLGEIRDAIESNYYKIDFTLDEIRPGYSFDVTCQGSVPQAIMCFLEAEDYEDAIRNAVSLGGDADTQAAMAGAIAEAFFGIPDELQEEGLSYLDDTLQEYYWEYADRLYN